MSGNLNQGQNDFEACPVSGPNSKTVHMQNPQLQISNHVKSKSFVHNNEFVSVSADNSQINNPNMNNLLIKQQQNNMQIPTIQNVISSKHTKKIMASQMVANEAD